MSTSVKISELPVLASADAADEFVVVDDSAGVTKKITQAGLANFGTNALTAGTVSASGLVTASGGITFGADTLDDYEEGTWTPTLPNGGTVTEPNATHSNRYIKIGNQVTVTMYANLVPTNNSSEFRIGGLPFAAGTGTSNYYGGSFGYTEGGNLSDWMPITGRGGSAFDYIYFHVAGAASRRTNAQFLTAMSGDDSVILTITYFVA